jgi:hypothetical protein
MNKNMNEQGIEPLINRFQMIQDRFVAEKDKTPSMDKILPLLIRGWDITDDRHKVDQPGDGIWRASHLAIVKNLDLERRSICPIIAAGMSKAELLAGSWRQIRIFPKSSPWRRDSVQTSQHADPFSPAAEPRKESANELDEIKKDVAADEERHISRDNYFVTLIGHTFEDVVEFLIELEKTNLELARLLLAKDFMAAIKAFPKCLELPWPESCLARFKNDKRCDYLPPILVLVLFAELACHAQGQAVHNRLSFDKNCNRVDLATVRKDIVTAHSGNSLAATKHLLQCKWMQTSALIAPTTIVENQDRAEAIEWVKHCKAKILEFTVRASDKKGERLNDALRPVYAPRPGEEVNAAISDFTAHPNAALIIRADETVSFPNRTAITFYGMTWRENASVAFLLIANQARVWNSKFRPSNPIPLRLRDDRPSLARAIAMLMFCWLETSVPAAFGSIYRDANSKHTCDKFSQIFLDPEGLINNQDCGKELLKQARILISRLPAAGNQGYSAFSHAALWFDLQHDDLSHYETMAKDSLRAIRSINTAQARRSAFGGLPSNIVVDLSTGKRGTGSLPSGRKKTAPAGRVSNISDAKICSISGKVAQAEAMLLGPFATDPMHACLLRSANAYSESRKRDENPSTSAEAAEMIQSRRICSLQIP